MAPSRLWSVHGLQRDTHGKGNLHHLKVHLDGSTNHMLQEPTEDEKRELEERKQRRDAMMQEMMALVAEYAPREREVLNSITINYLFV